MWVNFALGIRLHTWKCVSGGCLTRDLEMCVRYAQKVPYKDRVSRAETAYRLISISSSASPCRVDCSFELWSGSFLNSKVGSAIKNEFVTSLEGGEPLWKMRLATVWTTSVVGICLLLLRVSSGGNSDLVKTAACTPPPRDEPPPPAQR